MILFFGAPSLKIYAFQTLESLPGQDLSKLNWLFSNPEMPHGHLIDSERIDGYFIGPRKAMVTPWSTNAVEITQNMGIKGILRIEEYHPSDADAEFDPMIYQKYHRLDQDLFSIDLEPAPVEYVNDIAAYNAQEGLALSEEEIQYLNDLSERLCRKLTDSEVFGFSQVNSEHCRHKIFNGEFVIDGEAQPTSLFQMIKETSRVNPNSIVSAYKDNVAFIEGPVIEQFAPNSPDKPD